MALSSTASATQLDSTFGCLFIAVIFSSVLWGITCLQMYLYYEKFWSNDRTWFRVYLFVIWALDTVVQVLLSQITYVYFVRGIGDSTLLTVFPKTLSPNSIIIAIIDAMVQIIFIRRAWYIGNKNTILTGLMCLAVLAQFTVNSAYFGKIHGLTEVSQLAQYAHLELAQNCMTVFTDTFLALVTIFLLWKSRSGIKRTDSIINRLIMYTIGSGLVTALWALVALIGVITAPDSLVYLLCDFVIPKLYLNCVLASLNARSGLRGDLSKGVGGMNIRLENLPSTLARSSDTTANTSNKVGCHAHVDLERSDKRQLNRSLSRSDSEVMTNGSIV